jgi:hypothetical protein
MLTCDECKREEDVNHMVIYQGMKLCKQCTLRLMLTLLERVSNRLQYILEALNEVEARIGDKANERTA